MPCDQAGVGVQRRVPPGGLGDQGADVDPVDPGAREAQERGHERETGEGRDGHRNTGGQPELADERDLRGVEPEHRDHDRRGGEHHRAPAGGHRPPHRIQGIVSVEQHLAVPRDEEQRIVDADPESHHRREGGGGGPERDCGRRDPEEAEAREDAEDRAEQRHHRGEHRAEPDEQDEQGDGEAEAEASEIASLTLGAAACPS